MRKSSPKTDKVKNTNFSVFKHRHGFFKKSKILVLRRNSCKIMAGSIIIKVQRKIIRNKKNRNFFDFLLAFTLKKYYRELGEEMPVEKRRSRM